MLTMCRPNLFNSASTFSWSVSKKLFLKELKPSMLVEARSIRNWARRMSCANDWIRSSDAFNRCLAALGISSGSSHVVYVKRTC